MQRLSNIAQNLKTEEVAATEKDTLTITDQRSGKTVKIPVAESKDAFYIDAKDVGKLKDDKGEPVRVYDPGYMNTICNTSKICYIDGDQGILEYRGIPIEQLAEHSTFLEVAFLLINGELPTKGQLKTFEEKYSLFYI